MGEIEDIKPQLCKEFTEITDTFDLVGIVGEGNYSKVHEGVARSDTAVHVAIKIIPKRKKGIVHAVREEISILNELAHTNILAVREVQESELEMYLITDLLSGGTLMERVVEGFVSSERIAGNTFRQILFAVKHIHSHKIIHRDLKPQNIVYVNSSEHSSFKIIDFGGAVRIKKDEVLDKQVGTVKYMAPEMINKHEYSLPVDMWSLGVLLYLLLGGIEPFQGHGTDLYMTIREGHFAFPSPTWDPVSSAAKDMVNALLTKDPTKRVTADAAIQHPWIFKDKDRFLTQALPDRSAQADIKKFIAKRSLLGAHHALVFIGRVTRLAAHPSRVNDVRLHNAARPDGNRNLGPKRATQMGPGRVSRSPRNQTGHQTCGACGGALQAEQSIETHIGAFHESCFVCGGCGARLTNFVEGPGGQPYHSHCLPASASAVNKCQACGKQCSSGIQACGSVFHERCFTCQLCSQVIVDTENYEEWENAPHHRSCLQHQRVQEPWLHNTHFGSEPAPNYRPPPTHSRAGMGGNRIITQDEAHPGSGPDVMVLQSKTTGKFCYSCGSKYISASAKFCSHCGSPKK
eukprot:NODE_695_length_1942_cov_42.957576_g645_i0.p1 GENE.NODE_695_length_1942_cov_42.957576_g645_i0~~NODE_695_length_1942_cov_42.957576_g645_i0.p1  ORF type:complete len:574 (-),score=132.87 NODE_695_length_1942_cov_42.957576_g645_i0:161-1882(-)